MYESRIGEKGKKLYLGS